MFTANYEIVVEGQDGLRLWAREYGARLLAVEAYQNANKGRMITRSVVLLEDGVKIDAFDGSWLSGYSAQE